MTTETPVTITVRVSDLGRVCKEAIMAGAMMPDGADREELAEAIGRISQATAASTADQASFIDGHLAGLENLDDEMRRWFDDG